MLIAFNKRHNGHNLVYSKLYQKKNTTQKTPKSYSPKYKESAKISHSFML